MYTARTLGRLRTSRWYSSAPADKDFAPRRARIAQAHMQHYPSLSSVARDAGVQELRVPQFRAKFEQHEFPSTKRTTEPYRVTGKVRSIRRSGRGMLFVDVVQDFARLQLVASNQMMQLSKDEFALQHGDLRIGDSVVCIGYPGVTGVGELSLKARQPLQILSPSLHALPPKLTDAAKINSSRVVDYLVNARSQQIIVTKSRVVAQIRSYLDSRGFVEVETPILAGEGTGANAAPFVTSSQYLKGPDGHAAPLSLRVAPELWLKKLVISGFDKVYEIGKSFRNEGLDATHNPEFTTCEFYQTFTTLEELMQMTEELVAAILAPLESAEISAEPCARLRAAIAANDGHFARREFIPTVESQTGAELPHSLTAATLSAYFDKLSLEHPPTRSVAQYLDRLSSTYIEPLCQNDLPTFVYNQPSPLSPLAKSATASYGSRTYEISRRFELFINGKEYANSYEEENNPFKQADNFHQQQRAKDDYADRDALVPDFKFVENMELGMSPTGGWGLGVDRLVMLLTGSDRIEKVLPFGKLNDVLRQ